MSNKEIKVGDIVRYIGKEHDVDPEVNPPVGTLGKVLKVSNNVFKLYYIQWEKGSTSDDDCWYQKPIEIELAEDIVGGRQGKGEIIATNNTNMPNEAIWEFLKPKMEKNGLLHEHYRVGSCYFVPTYDCEAVQEMVALAYRSGYLRAMKGRPFKIGEKKEKKQGGRWVPVDPDNLPKEGTKVRYTRKCREYSENALYKFGTSVVEIGDTGRVNVVNDDWFGIKLDNPRSIYSWLSFDDEEIVSCLDMWVDMNIGDKVVYTEIKHYEAPFKGDTGIIQNFSKDGKVALVKFEFGEVWCMCNTLEVVE